MRQRRAISLLLAADKRTTGGIAAFTDQAGVATNNICELAMGDPSDRL
jgi:hypothetical protein